MSFPYTVPLNEEQIVATSATKTQILGTRGVTVDGRVFRYAQAGATALKAHMLCITAAQGPWSTATDLVFSSTYSAGTTQVYITDLATGSVAANDYQDGWLLVNSTDISYNQLNVIDSHIAFTSGTGGTTGVPVNLINSGLKKGVATSTSLVKLVANPYKAVVVSTDANGPGYPAGVTPCAVTASYYFWLQTWGPALAHAGEGISASIDKQPGRPLFWSTGSTGGVAHAMTASASGYIAFDTDSGFAQNIGRVGTTITTAPAANFFHMVHLTLAP